MFYTRKKTGFIYNLLLVIIKKTFIKL